MKAMIGEKEVVVSGGLFRIARLRHEWCEFLEDVPRVFTSTRDYRRVADLLTFVNEIGNEDEGHRYHSEPAAIAVLPIQTFSKWWDELGFKARNKIRKAEKSGVEVRLAQFDFEFAKAVEEIYNEAPIRQGRRFAHYGKGAAAILSELRSFEDTSILLGSYHKGELIGFMKLFQGAGVLRTVHIIAKLSHREKCAMDLMIAKAVELCEQRNARILHYGSWTDGGIGVFRAKHGFQRVEVPRYFVPLGWRGELMLKLNLHRTIRERLPKRVSDSMVTLRSKWNSMRFSL